VEKRSWPQIELVDGMGGVMSERKFGGKENARARASEC